MNKLYIDLKYEILKFVSYYELDSILSIFNLTPNEIVAMKQKLYEFHLTVVPEFYGDHNPDKIYKTKYLIENKLHCENDLPAIEWDDGGKEWFINGKHHRANGPAVLKNGDNDLPAVERSNGTKEWWLHGWFIR